MKFVIAQDSSQILTNIPHQPGIYLMHAVDDVVLYVGKAVDLQKRLSSYFRKDVAPKTRKLMELTKSIEITVTRNELEALLLEQTTIKTLLPRFNILLRDDKSYPYIYISAHAEYPQITSRRKNPVRMTKSKQTTSVKLKKTGEYYGPYANAHAVRSSLNTLQTIFKLRTCEDGFFAHRNRPCLQHQINRCSAPCVGLINQQNYQRDLDHARLFLAGKSKMVIDVLEKEMHEKSKATQYEAAANLRDQWMSLKQLQAQQGVDSGNDDADVLVCGVSHGVAVVQILWFRQGKLLGKQSYYPKLALELSAADILASFIAQYYLDQPLQFGLPNAIITNVEIDDKINLCAAIKQYHASKIHLLHQVRGVRAQWLDLANVNLQTALNHSSLHPEELFKKRDALRKALSLPMVPSRIECFDISHTQGEHPVASCVVFSDSGPEKKSYRQFNITEITPGDDYAAIRQAVKRRYTRVQQAKQILPDLLVIDGGLGQLTQALAVCEELELNELMVIAIAKGPTRKAGLERLFVGKEKAEIVLSPDDKALHLLQWIRDEAHRFAIKSHRIKRGKLRKQSILDTMPGIGPKRRRALLNHFGGLRELNAASIEDITKIPGISHKMAESLYNVLHGL